MALDGDLRFAILIDADNVSEKYIKIILDEVANAGTATYKRIYGDWTSPRLASWKSCLLDHSIIPMQQYSYTYGKNATDSAMIIDAMDILYSGTVDGFAIVSSDSDFTRLVARLRESGMQVIGMGEQKTPKPFISACNQFKYLDLLLAASKQAEAAQADEDDAEDGPDQVRTRRKRRQRRRGGTGESDASAAGADGAADAAGVSSEEVAGEQADGKASGCAPAPRPRPGDRGAGAPAASDGAAIDVDDADDPDDADASDGEVAFGEMSRNDRRRHLKTIRLTIAAIIDAFSDEDGWLSLAQLGDQLGRRLPDFDVRNYGYSRLSPFLKSLGVYEFDEPVGVSGARQIYLRIK